MKKLVGLFVFLFSAHASAFMIEPYLGYEMGKVELKSALIGNSDADTTGSNLGLRLGYEFPALVWIALDGGIMNGKYKTSTTESDYKATLMAVDVGVDLPILLRGWVGYGFSYENTLSSNGSDSKVKGNFTKVGLGFTGLPFVSLNVEYYMYDFKKVSSPGTAEADFSSVYSSQNANSTVLSVSLPLSL